VGNTSWHQSTKSLKTKVKIYRTTVLSTVHYGAEPWKCTDKEYRRLNAKLFRWAKIGRLGMAEKKIRFGSVAEGKKSAGKPKKNLAHCLQVDCARYGSWTDKVKYRTTWQKPIRP
jgi:hypothetical protein